MKHLSITFVCCLFLFLLSCKKTSERQKIWYEITSQKSLPVLEGKRLSHALPILTDGLMFFVNDSIFLANSNRNDSVFTFFKISDNELIELNSFGTLGGGPNETVSNFISYDSIKKMIYRYNIDGKIKTIGIDIKDDLDRVNDLSCYKSFYFPKNNRSVYRDMTLVSGTDSFLVLGGDPTKAGFLSLIDVAKGTAMDINLSLPEDHNRAKNTVKWNLYMQGCILSGNHNRFLYYCLEGRYAEIINIHNVDSVSRTVIAYDYPLYREAPDGVRFRREDDSYIGLYSFVTENRIYIMPRLLRNGELKQTDNYKGYPIYYSDELHIFDWDGNYIYSFQFDKPVMGFIVNKDDKYILASSINIEDYELEFERFVLPTEK